MKMPTFIALQEGWRNRPSLVPPEFLTISPIQNFFKN